MFREYLRRISLNELLCAAGCYRPFPSVCDRERWDHLDAEVKKYLVERGEDALNGYPLLTATQYMAYARSGNRKVFETPYFTRRTLLFGAALAECVENSGRFIDAIIDGLWMICEESTWVISAHNNPEPDDMQSLLRKPLPDTTCDNIDLFAAQTAAVLAYTVYFLESKLNEVSPLICERVRKEIDRRIFAPMLNHTDFWWMGYGSKTVNNWNPWIISNVLDAVMLLENNCVRRNSIVTRSLVILDHYLDVMPEDGGCDEGAGYFNVAGSSLLDCLETLYCASEGKINFYHEPHIAAIGTYPEKVHIAGPYYLNFADCDGKPMLDYERLYTYGLRTGNERLCHLGKFMYRSASIKDRLMIRDTPQINRVLFSLFCEMGEEEVAEPAPLPFMSMRDLQVYSWNCNGMYTAVKGGHNDESHNHNDIGNIVIYVDGEPEIVDMGNMVYTAATFGPDRYSLLNTRSRNHNVPMINGIEQCAGRSFCARNIRADEKGIELEIGNAYPQEAQVAKLHRGVDISAEKVTLHDEILLNADAPVTWVFMLKNKPATEDGIAKFGKLCMKFDADLSCKVEEIPISDERMKRSFEGSLWRLTFDAESALRHRRNYTIYRV